MIKTSLTVIIPIQKPHLDPSILLYQSIKAKKKFKNTLESL